MGPRSTHTEVKLLLQVDAETLQWVQWSKELFAARVVETGRRTSKRPKGQGRSEAPGDAAAAWWLWVLGERAQRWRPLAKDPAEMLQAGMDLRGWVKAGLQVHPIPSDLHFLSVCRIPRGVPYADVPRWLREELCCPCGRVGCPALRIGLLERISF